MQAYVNLATVLTDDYLTRQVGGQAHLESLRKLKVQYDPNNVFDRHPFVGLWTDSMTSTGRNNSQCGSELAANVNGDAKQHNRQR